MRKFTMEEARSIGAKLGINWHRVDMEQFRRGLEVETEHDTKSKKTDVVKKDVDIGKIALAHLQELPDYYTRLDKMEAGGERDKLKSASDRLFKEAMKKGFM